MEIKHTETKQLDIHHMYKVTPDAVAIECIGKYQGHKELFWSKGILFTFEQITPIIGEEIIKDFINGNEYWYEVYYAEMPEYREYIELEEGEFKGARVRVVNAEGFSPHREFSAWVTSGK